MRPEWLHRLIVYGFMLGAMLVGLHLLHNQVERNCASQVYALRVILQEIHPAPDADPGLRATIDHLNHDYAIQYARIYDFLHGDRCASLLPSTTPPAPTVPKHMPPPRP